MPEVLTLPNVRVYVLDQCLGFDLVAIAQQIPSLFYSRAKVLIKVKFLQADDSVDQRAVGTICHRCF